MFLEVQGEKNKFIPSRRFVLVLLLPISHPYANAYDSSLALKVSISIKMTAPPSGYFESVVECIGNTPMVKLNRIVEGVEAARTGHASVDQNITRKTEGSRPWHKAPEWLKPRFR